MQPVLWKANLAMMLVGVALLAAVERAPAQCRVELVAADTAANDAFGVAVAMSGDVAVIGASHADAAGTDSGAAYVFRYDGADWVEEAKLVAEDGAAWDWFGRAVAVSHDTIAIGAYRDGDQGSESGAVYVFRHDGSAWAQQAKLVPAVGGAEDRFGIAVAVADDTIIVGAPRDDDQGSDSGSAYVFHYDGLAWVETGKLYADDAAAGDHFGIALAVSGDALLIGAPQRDEQGSGSGAAYVFRLDESVWSQEAKLLPDDRAAGDWFGAGVALHADLAVIGAWGDDDDTLGTDSGSAYVFRFDAVEWTQQAKLLPPTGAAHDNFGYAAAASDDMVLVGAPRDDDQGDDSGSCYLFRYDGAAWDTGVGLPLIENAALDNLGYAVALESGVALAGAWGHDGHGSAFVFRGMSDCDGDGTLDFSEVVEGTATDCNDNCVPDECDLAGGTSEDCNDNGVPDECDIADGTSEDCTGNGIPDECEPDCNDNGVADSCDIADGTSADCQPNGVPDECDIADGTSEDVDGDGVPDECQTDCNLNGQPDTADIDDGTSLDCNENLVPDECEIDESSGAPGGPFFCTEGCDPDCNNNGIPDECDIAGDSKDCDENGVPDECQPDGDGDGVIDACDGCPEDEFKTEPGVCGCGQPDDDDDADGVVDCVDECLDTPAGWVVGANGCPANDCNGNAIDDAVDIADGTSEDCDSNGYPDECQRDRDGDGVIDRCDNCPDVSNPDQADSNGDGVGDACSSDDHGPPTVPPDGSSDPGDPNQPGDSAADKPDVGEPTDGSPGQGGDFPADGAQSAQDIPDVLMPPGCGAAACGAGVIGWLPLTLLGLCVLKKGIGPINF